MRPHAANVGFSFYAELGWEFIPPLYVRFRSPLPLIFAVVLADGISILKRAFTDCGLAAADGEILLFALAAH